MEKISVLIHPNQRFWAAQETDEGTQVVFGLWTPQYRVHPKGYATHKILHLRGRGYTRLLDEAEIPSEGLTFNLLDLTRHCRDLLNRTAAVLPEEHAQVLRAMHYAHRVAFFRLIKHSMHQSGQGDSIARLLGRSTTQACMEVETQKTLWNQIVGEEHPGRFDVLFSVR